MPIDSFPQILARFARERAEEAALVAGEERLSWRELDEASSRLAVEFTERGVQPQSLVALALPNGFGFYVCAFAAWKIAATPMPVSYEMPDRELSEVLALAAPSLAIGSAAKPAMGITEYRALSQAAAGRTAGRPLPEAPVQWKAITSGGSTGRPKVIVSLGAAECDPSLGVPSFLLRPNARQLLLGPVYHNGPFVSSIRGLMSGGTIHIAGRFNAATALDDINRLGINWMQIVPTMMARMCRADPDQSHQMPSLDGILHLGAQCPEWVKREWIRWIGPDRVIELYGSTEAQATTIITGTEWLERPGSVGKPGRHPLDANVAGNPDSPEIVIRDSSGELAPSGETGEIWCRVRPGQRHYRYIGAQPTRSGEWESVGDLGYMDEDGYLYIRDRRVDLIVSGGVNVYPAEVEAAILEHPRVNDCVVVGVPDPDLGRRVHAIIEPRALLTVDDLEPFVLDRLARAKVPRSWEFVTELPRNAAGKIRRSAIAATYLDAGRAS
jgi:bile acid-coenzyme A ligase